MNRQLLRRNYQKSIFVYGLVLLILTVNGIIPSQVEAQSFQWSPAQIIPGYSLDDKPPILVADQNRTVHAFTSEWLSLDGAASVKGIIYNQWSLEGGWTNPIDILLSPFKEARVTDAYLDQEGFINVVFFGGDSTAADIYYSKAPLGEASNARSWSVPTIIGEKAGNPESAVFAEDDKGYLHVIYSGRQYGNGVYVVSSMDSGETWSESIPIFLTNDDAPYISLLHAIHGDSGWLHVIWNVFTVGGQGRGVYYSRSEDGDKWSEPALLAYTPDGLGTSSVTIIEHEKTLFAIYILPPKITMRRSTDNGETWQDPVIIFPRHVGVNGSPSPVVDSSGNLHLFFGQRISGSPDIHGMWHSIWVNDRWTEPEAVVKGPRVADNVGESSFDPVSPHAVVSQGNVLLVTWSQDPGLEIKPNGVWYSYQVLDTPELPLEPLQALPQVMSTAEPSILPTSFSLDESTHSLPTALQDQPNTSYTPLYFVGFSIVVFLVLLARTVVRNRYKKQ